MAETQNTHESLLSLYNAVDSYLRQQYKQDKYATHSFLIQELSRSNRVVARYQQELRSIAQLRNNLIHNPFANVADPIAEPHPAVVERYKEIHDLLINPNGALTIAVPANKIFTATLDSNLNEVLKKMDKNIFTHVPIIEDEKMVGVFSENTLLTYFAESEEAIITKDSKIRDFSEYLALDSHNGEKFVFLPRKASLSKVYDIFNKAIQKHERIGVMFITENGKETEKPLGIITAWDLASPEFELQ